MDGDYDSDGDSDKRQLHRQQRYKMVCIRKLCGNGMQKKREIFFFFYFVFFSSLLLLLLLLSKLLQGQLIT